MLIQPFLEQTNNFRDLNNKYEKNKENLHFYNENIYIKR